MKKNSLWKSGEQIYRILEVKEDTVFVIDCVKRTMPKWIGKDKFSDCIECIEKELILSTGIEIPDEETMNAEDRRFIREHFTMIAPILPFVSDEKKRAYAELFRVMPDILRAANQDGADCVLMDWLETFPVEGEQDEGKEEDIDWEKIQEESGK